MFQQIAKDRGVHNLKCDAVIEYNGVLSCDFPEKPVKNDDQIVEIEHDHKYVHWDDAAEDTVVLYANFGTKKFQEYHNKLKSLASQGKVKYMFRPFLAERPDTPLRLSGMLLSQKTTIRNDLIKKTFSLGYGVELQIKSSEYKAQDDRKVQDDGQAGEDSEQDKGEDKSNIMVKIIYSSFRK